MKMCFLPPNPDTDSPIVAQSKSFSAYQVKIMVLLSCLIHRAVMNFGEVRFFIKENNVLFITFLHLAFLVGVKASALCHRWALVTQKGTGKGTVSQISSFFSRKMFLVPDSYTEFSSVILSKVFGIFPYKGSSSCHVSEPGASVMAEKSGTWVLSAHLRAGACNTCDCISP